MPIFGPLHTATGTHTRYAKDIESFSDASQAAAKGDARAAVGRQLQTWLDAQFLMHIDQERLRVYQLLAGHIDAIVPHMDLDWRRAFGLHFWCGPLLNIIQYHSRM